MLARRPLRHECGHAAPACHPIETRRTAMTDTLYTLAAHSALMQEIRHSRFLAQAAPVASPAQALDFVRQVADAGATHNCWAFRVGADYRFHDDGEPGGTAGRPILQAIEGQSMDQVAVVVTRWYGGVKLGTGGLMRAYGGTAATCLREAARVAIVAMATLQLTCALAELALIRARLVDLGATLEQPQFEGALVTLRLCLPVARVVQAQARISDLSRGRSQAQRID